MLIGSNYGKKNSQEEKIKSILDINSENINAGYILNLSDAVMFNKALVDRYLDILQKEAPIFSDKTYFQYILFL